MRRVWFLILAALLAGAPSAAPTKRNAARRTLDIYYVDVEGGAATLIVTPAGESILIDAGWPGNGSRDAKRIQQAMRQAGVAQIDHLIITHYHIDHFGGLAELAQLVQVKHFYDRGPLAPETSEYKGDPKMYQGYLATVKNRNTALKPGDTIQLKAASGQPPVTLRCLAAGGQTLVHKAADAQNQACASATSQPEDTSDNARSVVLRLGYGGFDFFDAGDLTWNVEQKLVCPSNLVGEVDLYQVTHHGMNISNNPVLLNSLRPTVAIMNNGPRKGGHPDTVKWLREVSSIKDIYQVHRNVAAGVEQNAPAEFIANLDEQHEPANLITVSVDAAKKVFTVTNGRTGASKSYPFK